MASNIEEVEQLLEELRAAAMPAAKNEISQLQQNLEKKSLKKLTTKYQMQCFT